MEFRTIFPIQPSERKINIDSTLFSIGSCFSTMVGHKLEERKFQVLNNPFGTIFNPVSLFHLLQQSLLNQHPDESLLVEHDQRYYHYSAHSDLSHAKEDQLLSLIAQKQLFTRQFLSETSHIFITFGTAFVYELASTGQVVANCHKQPQRLFNKRLLTMEEMETSFRSFYNILGKLNPKAGVILTVSPVRHTKDGIPENQLSKSLLRVLVHQIQTAYPEVSYFPSYELMMDDLRDYRYYKDDMIHPSPFAENYIWEQFKSTYLDKATSEAVKNVDGILNALKHKPFHPEGASHQQFLHKLLHQMERMAPAFDFSKEIIDIKDQLNQPKQQP